MLYGSHSDIRYYLPAGYLRKNYRHDSLILEVGSGPVGISRYWKGNTVGLDINVRKKDNRKLCLVEGAAERLPFKDQTFDFTLSIDFLEHIPQAQRKTAVSEMLRVTKGDVFIGVPFGRSARLWEDKARKVCEAKLRKWRKRDRRRASALRRKACFLHEHKRMGLPPEEELLDLVNRAVRQSGRKVYLEIFENESLWVWYFYLLAELKYSYFRWFITSVVCFFAYRLLRRAKWGGCYRKIVIIKGGK